MADATGISWTDVTFNPWIGCAKVSPGCAHCYAETLSKNRMGISVWGEDAPRRIAAESTWKKPLTWNRNSEREGRTRYGGGPEERIRVFCASMADVFEDRPDLVEPRKRLIDLIYRTPALDWLLLTKRPENVGRMLGPDGVGLYAVDHGRVPCPQPNIWLGVSVENARHTWRADVLRGLPAALRFISAEPLLGSLYPKVKGEHYTQQPLDRDLRPREPRGNLNLLDIDWVIVGGESGSRANARPMHPEWAREIRNACVTGSPHAPRHFGAQIMAEAGANLLNIPLHFKQWGSWAPDPNGHDPNGLFVLPDGAAASAFDADRYGIELHGAVRMGYVGPQPKAGGKLLDGIEWCEIPEHGFGQLTLA